MLNFPNKSRRYDPASNRINFWGHDETIEVPFFLQVNALARLDPLMANTEAGVLLAFDNAWLRIVEMARAVYRRGQRSFYVLGPDSVS